MPLTNFLPWLFAAVVASVAAMVTGALVELPVFAWCGALLFALALVATSIDLNMTWWKLSRTRSYPSAPLIAAIENSRLLVVGYTWGACALFAIYRMTPLRWQHGLQYGAGMAVIAWLILLYGYLLAQPQSRLRTPRALAHATWLLVAQSAGALAGLTFLIGSGKLGSVKDDWPANQVFLAGGIAIAVLSAIASYTQLRLARQTAGREGSND